MKPVLSVFTCFSGTLASLASTTALDVGGTQLTVPSPAGFAVVPPEMTLLLNRLDSFVTPANQRLLWFLDDRELAKARAGLVPEAARSLSVQCAKKDIQKLFTKPDFAKLKKMIREQNAELIKKVEQQMPGYMDKVNKGIQKQFDWSGELGIDGYIPVAGQEETERSVSYPMIVKYSVKERDGRQRLGTSVVTATFLHVKGRIIFLYCNDGQNDLQWARTISKDWASAIVAANPSDAAIAAKESAGSGSGYNWKAVPLYVIVIGAISVVLCIVKWFNRGRTFR